MSRAAAGRSRAQAVVSGARTPEYSFGIVLVLILASLTFQVAAPEAEWSRFVTLIIHGAVLLAAIDAAHAHRALLGIAGVAIAVAIIVSGFALVGPGEVSEAPAGIVNLMFIGMTPLIVARGLLRDIRDEGAVTIRTMLGVLCIYLLIGIFFAFMYGVIDEFASEEFFPRVDPADTSDFVYFSFSTLTTVGYGDLVTTNEVGRSLAITEALIGQIYLVTIVALIIANMRPARSRERS
jgi:hypothetical protein